MPARARDDARNADAGERAALRLFRESLWPDVAGRAEVDAPPVLGRFALLDRYRRRYPLSRLIVAVVGNVDPGAVAATLTRAFPATSSSAPPSSAPASPSALPVPRADAQGEGPTTVFRSIASSDSTAVVGYPTASAGDATRAIEVLAEVLTGEGGRLPAVLADERTLGCRASARISSAGSPGSLALIVRCPPARLDAAVAATRGALGRVVSAGITPDEVGRAARRLIGARAAALRTRAAVADALVRDEAAGLPLLAYRQAPAALARVTVADVARAAQAIIDPRREIIAVVHPPSAAPALARASGASRPGRAESER